MKRTISLLCTLCLISGENSPVEKFTKASNLFARSIYKEIAKTKSGNFLVSPFSAEIALAFAQSGARGESAEELRNALHLSNDQSQIESAIKTLIPKFPNDVYSLHTANKLYIKEGFSIRNDFKDSASQVYHAHIDAIDFTKNVQAANAMNHWVEKNTNDKIKHLIGSDELDDHTRAILINALYFKANWSKPFLVASTYKRDFHKLEGDVDVDFLHHYEEYFRYYECPHLKVQVLELPFEGGEASMIIVLPQDANALSDLEDKLEKKFDARHQLKPALLNVALPKFRIESLIDFEKILQKLGVKKIFDKETADLSGIAGEKGDLYIEKVVQKSFIDVSEEGVEAAAATYILLAIPMSAIYKKPTPKNFIANHPFIFYIKVKDLIIFTGRVTDPSKS